MWLAPQATATKWVPAKAATGVGKDLLLGGAPRPNCDDSSLPQE